MWRQQLSAANNGGLEVEFMKEYKTSVCFILIFLNQAHAKAGTHLVS